LKRYKVSYRLQAEADLDSLHRSLSERHSPEFADRYLERLAVYLRSFEFAPHRGTQRSRPGLRIVGWKKQLTIGFRVYERPRQVVIFFIAGRGRNVLGRRGRG